MAEINRFFMLMILIDCVEANAL